MIIDAFCSIGLVNWGRCGNPLSSWQGVSLTAYRFALLGQCLR
jgi:hypothetical protein